MYLVLSSIISYSYIQYCVFYYQLLVSISMFMTIIRHPCNWLNDIWQYLQVTTYWQKLAWPDEAEGNGIAKQLMQQCCSLGLLYTKLVISKLEVILQEKTDPKVLLLSAEVSLVVRNKMESDWLWWRLNMRETWHHQKG